MSKTKVVAVGKTKLVALGVGGFLAWLIFGAKKASARTLSVPKVPKSDDVVIDERPAAQDEPAPAPKPVGTAPAKKGGGKKPVPKATPAEPTNDQAQAALDQAWPLIEGGRASRDTLTAALRWAKQIGDNGRAAEILKLLGGP